MLQSKLYEIDSTDDVELGVKRSSKLEFKVVFDEAKPIKALFAFVGGCGTDALNGSYPQHIAEFVAENYGAAVLLVDYHCARNRAQLGAKHYFDEIDLAILTQSCQSLGITLPAALTPTLNECGETFSGYDKILLLLNYLNENLQLLKNEHKLASHHTLTLTISLKPPKNEYQNFGVMQALDILNALYFVKKSGEFSLEKDCKVLIFGSSHGGYLALLCAKFAPWLIDAVVENSAYALTPARYVGIGKQLDYEKHNEAQNEISNLTIHYFTKSLWSIDRASPHFFSPAHNRIRNILDVAHLQTAAGHFKPKIISYHGLHDLVAPVSHKQELHRVLAALGFDNRLFVASSEGDIDGKFIKNLEHGMDMSLKTLIKRELPPLLEAKFTHEMDEARQICYESENLEYIFKETQTGGGN